jgi:Fic family protein
MKMPQRPPNFAELMARFAGDGSIPKLLNGIRSPSVEGKYLHWDQIRHRTPPAGCNHEKWWFGLKARREASSSILPLSGADGVPFRYTSDPLTFYLHQVDMGAAGSIQQNEPVTNPETKDFYLVRSLVEESITSSQLEGASTTREVAKQMIMEKRRPRDRSERMIMNNYQTMERILELRDQDMTRELLLEIHSLVTENALDNPSAHGRFRRPDENIVLSDIHGEVLHVPPPAAELAARIDALLSFANRIDPARFVHPFLKSMILHFVLAYEHPFVDGNGRTARALFYWSMLKHGYWLFEYISISKIILKSPVRYGMAFLHSETDDNDLTYFLLYHAGVVLAAIEELHQYIDRRTKEVAAVIAESKGQTGLNHRQRELIAHALKHPNQLYSVAYHQRANGVVYETARKDLHELARRGFLQKRKVGRTWSFRPARDLQERLRKAR